ncbi:MAG: TolC family protein [Myxococcales bacterium]|nr:TolC family protein [Myxococcales bacterium]
MCPDRSRRRPVAFVLFLVGACSAARPPAPDLQAALNELDARPPFAAVAPTAAGAFDPADGVDLREAQMAALVLHPSLHAARAAAGIYRAAKDARPGFPNPTLDVAAQGVLESVPDPWKVSVGIGFAIPLGGRLDAETQLWDARHQQALWDVVALERRHQRRVQKRWARWMGHLERATLLERHADALDVVRALASELTNAGELSPAGLALLDARRRRVVRDRAEAESDAALAAMDLLQLIGVRADAPLRFVPSWALTPPEPNNLGVTTLPSVRAAQAASMVAAAAVQEVSERAAPDLTVGPTFEHDRGQNAVGVALSTPLPFLDRQRRGRAEAEARAALATAHLEAALLEAQAGLVTARAATQMATARLERADAAAADVDALVERVKALVRGGEVELWVVGEALSEQLDARLSALDARVALASAVADLAFYVAGPEGAR